MTILYILLAIVILLILITVHEFGHYIAGKILKFKINEFSIGFGPTIFQKKKKDGELFSIRMLPLGGYCAFEGEDEDKPNNPGAFNNQKPWKRLIVTVAGVVFNFLFGIIMSAIFLMVSGYAVPKVTQLAPNNNYFKVGDVIKAVDGQSLEIYRHMADVTAKYGENEEFTVSIIRNGETITQTVSKKKYDAFIYVANPEWVNANLYDIGSNKISADQLTDYFSSFELTKDADGKYQYPEIADGTFKVKNENGEFVGLTNNELIKQAMISIAPDGVSLGFVYSSFGQNYGFFEALGKAWPFAVYICGVILKALGGIFTGATQIRDLGGTVTAVSQMAEISKMGFTQFLMLFPLLSFNLALFNILPIPALDGARAVFIIIEMIARKPVPRKIEGIIHTVGLILLLALVVFLDVYHFFIM